MSLTRHAPWLCLCTLLGCAQNEPGGVRIGSKKFTESVLLGEMARQLLEARGENATHRRELGGTRILWDALRSGQIDLYPEYTGTLVEELLREESLRSPGKSRAARRQALSQALSRRGVRIGRPLGFNNTYAIGMREERAAALGITTISDLAQHPTLRYGFTAEFVNRKDGWPGLAAHYSLAPENVVGLDHDLAYRGLAEGTLDVTDLYSTDADIDFYGLRVLSDDRDYFPEYQAVFLYRAALARDHPDVVAAVERLAGTLDAAAMRQLNGDVKLRRKSERSVAAAFLKKRLGVDSTSAKTVQRSRAARIGARTLEHLGLTGGSLAGAIVLAIPLGILAAKRRYLGQVVLGLSGALQTIPALALLVFMIPLFGIGAPPALAALFLYSLLPIVRNTHAGLQGIDPRLRESARALGLPAGARLRLVELPLAAPSILAGIKTSAVINIGTATLGALIGAGGYGQPILTGIRLSDQGLILEGAIPAALLALLAQGAFDLIERAAVPRGLRIGR